MTERHAIHVQCEPDARGWQCTVVIGVDRGATTHRVAVTSAELERRAPPGVAVERLVDASFLFLLEREPRESILREFDLPLIGRYFPEYDAVIGRVFARNDAGV